MKLKHLTTRNNLKTEETLLIEMVLLQGINCLPRIIYVTLMLLMVLMNLLVKASSLDLKVPVVGLIKIASAKTLAVNSMMEESFLIPVLNVSQSKCVCTKLILYLIRSMILLTLMLLLILGSNQLLLLPKNKSRQKLLKRKKNNF
jgi:hypothetical protein